MPITRTYYKVHRCFPDPDYFYLENISNSNTQFYVEKTGTPASTDLAYSLDKVTWTDIHNGGTVSNIAVGAKVYLRSSTGFSTTGGNYYKIGFTHACNAGGHIATLFNYTNTSAVTSIPDYGLYSIFKESGIVHANIDFYGIKNLGYGSCWYMFTSSNHIVTVPDFSGIETLDRQSLYSMCQNCSSLMTPLDLSGVTSCGDQALTQLYRGCTLLTEAIAPNLSVWSTSWTNSWLMDTASTGVVRKPAGLTIPTNTNDGVPTGWTTEDY